MVPRRKRSKLSRMRVKDAKLDYISCLPGHVIDQILSYLPIKEAARTSVLSKKWSNKWYTLPNLVFDRDCVSTAASQDPSVINNNFSRIVDHVLLLHYGSINRFEIYAYDCKLIGVNPAIDIQRWILHLIRRSIKELALNIFIKQRYKIPWCLFSCQSLCHLELNFCRLKPPTTFEGFKNLKSLRLNNVTTTQDAFENLISNSPLLEILIVNRLDGFKKINIHGPKLKVLDFGSDFEDIRFDNTFQLVELLLDLHPRYDQIRSHGCTRNLLRFFVQLPQIQSLEINNCCLKYLTAGVVVPVKLSTPCINLRSLSLCIYFDNLKDISAVLCLLKSSPNLQKLEIFALSEETDLLTPTSYCWENIFSEPTIPIQVRHVRLYGIIGTKLELDFIKFLLLCSAMLEEMILEPDVNVKLGLKTELMWFKRASRQAEVFYKMENSSAEVIYEMENSS